MYVLPTFNLMCDIYDWIPGGDPVVTPRLSSECNLALGRRVQVSSTGGTGLPGVQIITTTVLLPAATDVRAFPCYGDFGQGDILEVPQGSGRIYFCCCVEDCGKGFDNEHRVAYCRPAFEWGNWPIPIP